MCTKEQALQILSEAYERCQVLYEGRVRDAYLYGSYARGDFHAESDVDIMMVVSAQDEFVRERRWDLFDINSDLSLEHDITVSVKAAPVGRFERMREALPYYRNIRQEGIRYDKP